MIVNVVCLALHLYGHSYYLEHFGLYLSGEFGDLASYCKKWSVCCVFGKKKEEEEEEDSVYSRPLSFDFVERMVQLYSEFSQAGLCL